MIPNILLATSSAYVLLAPEIKWLTMWRIWRTVSEYDVYDYLTDLNINAVVLYAFQRILRFQEIVADDVADSYPCEEFICRLNIAV